MPKVQVDFSNVKDQFEPVPSGLYIVKITDCEEKGPGPSGHKYLNWEFTVEEGEHAGSVITTNTTLNPKGLFNLQGLLQAAGADPGKEIVDLDTDDFLGTTLQLSVTKELMEGSTTGRMTNQVQQFIAIG